jgi:catechol 2,3-dioxygenase-like lactoylglutathione lyase family enzyme
MLASIPLQARLPASDLDRARTWYREKLALEPEHQDMGGLWYRTGGQWFLVFQTPNAGTARSTAAGWVVPDLRTLMADLRFRGVVFDDVDMGGGFATINGLFEYQGYLGAWFRDSEGNTIELSQVPGG